MVVMCLPCLCALTTERARALQSTRKVIGNGKWKLRSRQLCFTWSRQKEIRALGYCFFNCRQLFKNQRPHIDQSWVKIIFKFSESNQTDCIDAFFSYDNIAD